MEKRYTVYAFCKGNEGGNAAGVVLDCDHYSDVQKQNIATEIGYSETVFVCKSAIADWQLSYFTPVEEVPLCGHATIAAFVLMKKLDILLAGTYHIETKAGIFEVRVGVDGEILMEQQTPLFYEFYEPSIFANCLPSEWCDNKMKIQAVSTGLKDIMMPIDTKEHLAKLQPNFIEMAALNSKQDVVGIHAFTLNAEEGITAICRNFAPRFGINEESATGTSNCALACYLFHHWKQQNTYTFEQGRNMGMTSKIVVKIESKEGEIIKVMVGGSGRVID